MRLLAISTLLSILMLSISCEKTQLETYSGERLLYFSQSNADSIALSLANISPAGIQFSDTVDYNLVVGMFGYQLEKDIPYKLRVYEEDSLKNGVEKYYVLPDSFLFKANSSIDTLNIKFVYTPELQYKTRTLTLELVPDDNFNNSLLNVNRDKTMGAKVKFHISAKLLNPPNWDDDNPFLGVFSNRKLEFIKFLYPYWDIFTLYRNVGANSYYFGSLMYRQMDFQKSMGRPVLESDGKEMRAGDFFYN